MTISTAMFWRMNQRKQSRADCHFMLRSPASRLTEILLWPANVILMMMMMMPQLIVSDYCADGKDGDDTDNEMFWGVFVCYWAEWWWCQKFDILFLCNQARWCGWLWCWQSQCQVKSIFCVLPSQMIQMPTMQIVPSSSELRSQLMSLGINQIKEFICICIC